MCFCGFSCFILLLDFYGKLIFPHVFANQLPTITLFVTNYTKLVRDKNFLLFIIDTLKIYFPIFFVVENVVASAMTWSENLLKIEFFGSFFCFFE